VSLSNHNCLTSKVLLELETESEEEIDGILSDNDSESSPAKVSSSSTLVSVNAITVPTVVDSNDETRSTVMESVVDANFIQTTNSELKLSSSVNVGEFLDLILNSLF